MSRRHSIRGGFAPSMSTASNRHGGSWASVARYACAAAMSRACFAAVMLAAAPPYASEPRFRTSTKTSVSRSRAMTSISPKRVRKLRVTIARPRAARKAIASDSAIAPSSVLPREFAVPPRLRLSPLRCPQRGRNSRLGSALRRESARSGVERNELPIAVYRWFALTDERLRVVLLDASSRAVEQKVLRRIRRERLRNSKCVEPESVKTVERRAREIMTRIHRELRRIGRDEPRQLDDAHIV